MVDSDHQVLPHSTESMMRPGKESQERWELRLFVAGMTVAARSALANLNKICEEHLADRYSIEIVDIIEKPELAEGHQIMAVPTLVRQFPTPVRKIIGDLSVTEKVILGLEIGTIK